MATNTSNLRKVIHHKQIILTNDKDHQTVYRGSMEHIVSADIAKQLVAKGAKYVDDADYNETITAQPKAEPAEVPATQPKDKK